MLPAGNEQRATWNLPARKPNYPSPMRLSSQAANRLELLVDASPLLWIYPNLITTRVADLSSSGWNRFGKLRKGIRARSANDARKHLPAHHARTGRKQDVQKQWITHLGGASRRGPQVTRQQDRTEEGSARNRIQRRTDEQEYSAVNITMGPASCPHRVMLRDKALPNITPRRERQAAFRTLSQTSQIDPLGYSRISSSARQNA
jgi:hypothetical protein